MMNRGITDLRGRYRQDPIDRRVFFKKLAFIAGGAVAANAVLPMLGGRAAEAAIVSVGDARLYTGAVEYPGKTGEIGAYLARPKAAGKLPGVVVIHENKGLNPHIEDVCRRIAVEGFLSIAPDGLSPFGGTPKDRDEARGLIKKLDKESTLGNFVAAAKYLKTHPRSTGKVGVVGFCWGGAMANQLAVHSADVTAAVPYYGRQPASGDVPRIKASLLLHYAGLDDRINKGIPEFEAALRAAKVDYALYMYPGAKHAFNNDTNPERYNREAAQLAWKRTIAFLNEKLKE